MKKVLILLVLVVILATSCYLIDNLSSLGSWKYTGITYDYENEFVEEYNIVETLTFSFGNVAEVEGCWENTETDVKYYYSGSGTFRTDGDSLSIDIDLTENDTPISENFIINKSYDIDGIVLTIDGADYYKQ